jgi:hypothetical protein
MMLVTSAFAFFSDMAVKRYGEDPFSLLKLAARLKDKRLLSAARSGIVELDPIDVGKSFEQFASENSAGSTPLSSGGESSASSSSSSSSSGLATHVPVAPKRKHEGKALSLEAVDEKSKEEEEQPASKKHKSG